MMEGYVEEDVEGREDVVCPDERRASDCDTGIERRERTSGCEAGTECAALSDFLSCLFSLDFVFDP